MITLNIESIRNEFPALKSWTYLDSAFVGLYPRHVRKGYDEFLDKWMNFNAENTKTILTEWLEKTENVRNMVAQFIAASSLEIAFTTCTGSGLNIVINGTDWKKGDNVVFPVNEHNPLDTNTLRKNGVESRAIEIKDGKIDLSLLDDAVDDRTRLVQVSQVSYTNGFRFDLSDISEIAHEHDARVLVDSTQALGAVTTDVKKDKVDYVSAAPYKYLMGPAGLAFLYVRSEHIKDLTPDRVGWKNQIWEGDHAEQPLENMESAKKFEYGTLHFQGMYGLEKSLEYINIIGIEAIERRILGLTDYLWSRLHDVGKSMYTPEGTKSPIVSFYEQNSVEKTSNLMKEKIKVTGRETQINQITMNNKHQKTNHIRASCHFYNNKEDIDHFIETIKQI